jgi:mannitol/fructose-specific phosphotransferase system IIA component (Ntr-type)
VPLEANTKQEAIFELIDLIAQKHNITTREELRDAVWQRESTRSTGIGHGIAIPHGKTSGCTGLCLAIGITKNPIEFNAIDLKPVSLIILLISPPDQPGPHIQALAKISRMLNGEKFRLALKSAPDAAAVFKLISDFESADQL